MMEPSEKIRQALKDAGIREEEIQQFVAKGGCGIFNCNNIIRPTPTPKPT